MKIRIIDFFQRYQRYRRYHPCPDEVDSLQDTISKYLYSIEMMRFKKLVVNNIPADGGRDSSLDRNVTKLISLDGLDTKPISFRQGWYETKLSQFDTDATEPIEVLDDIKMYRFHTNSESVLLDKLDIPTDLRVS